MKIHSVAIKVSTFSLVAVIATLGLGGTAFAHVTVKPAEAVTAGYQTFTVGVPNEKEIPTVSVKVLIPDTVEGVTPTQKAGWHIVKETEGTGEEAKTKSITWEGGTIESGLRDEFTFSAKLPEKATDLKWKAYQTYSDGTVVSWDKENNGGHDEEGGNSGPFSVTKVVAESAQDAAAQKVDQAAADARTIAERSLYIGVSALALSIVGIFLGTRKKQHEN